MELELPAIFFVTNCLTWMWTKSLVVKSFHNTHPSTAFSSPAHLFEHFLVSPVQPGLNDQAKLPKRPLIVYRVGADERHAGGESRKLIKSVSGGRWCLGLAWWAVKITIITFITPADCLELGGGGWGVEGHVAPNRLSHLQTYDDSHYHKVTARGGRSYVTSQTIRTPSHRLVGFWRRRRHSWVRLTFDWLQRHSY